MDLVRSARGKVDGVDDGFFDWMEARYSSWCVAADTDLLLWGVCVFKKKSVREEMDDNQRSIEPEK